MGVSTESDCFRTRPKNRCCRHSGKTCFSLIRASADPRFFKSLFLLGWQDADSPGRCAPTVISPPSCEIVATASRDLSSWKLLLREILPRRFADPAGSKLIPQPAIPIARAFADP